MGKIPNSISESFIELTKILEQEHELEWFKNEEETSVVLKTHSGLGMYIRNEWNMWSRSGLLFEKFSDLDVEHPDDISSIILTSFHRHLNDKEMDINGQIEKVNKSYNKTN